jgi:hypothetical protein
MEKCLLLVGINILLRKKNYAYFETSNLMILNVWSLEDFGSLL